MYRLVGLIVIVSVIAWPDLVGADGLVPCGGVGEDSCELCHLMQLTHNVIGWLVGVLSLVATIMIVVAGLYMATSRGNASALATVKRYLHKIIVGFILVLGAWFLVDAFLKLWVKDSVLGVWNEIQCVAQPEPRG